MKNACVIHVFSKEIFISHVPTQIKGKTVLHAHKLCFIPILLCPLQNVTCGLRLCLCGITVKYSDQSVYNISIEIFLRDRTA